MPSFHNQRTPTRHTFIRRLLPMLLLVITILPDLTAQDKQPMFVWRKTSARSLVEAYGVELLDNGRGEFYFKKQDQVEIRLPIALKPSVIERLVTLFVRADFLNETKEFASHRKVADMGIKTVQYRRGQQVREVSYNYTEDRTMQEISTFFENLCSQERALFEMDLALRYDRLGIPKQLDELDRSLSAKRIVAPERFAPVLERIYKDHSLMNLARQEARKLLSRIEKMSTVDN